MSDPKPDDALRCDRSAVRLPASRNTNRESDRPESGTSPHYAVHVVARPGRLSDAERAEGAANLARDFGDYESFRQSWREEKPPPPAKSIPVLTADGGNPIDLVTFLTDTLGRLSYELVGREAFEARNVFGFRAQWSTGNVEHYLEFVSSGRPTQYLSASVSLRHPQADRFANGFMLGLLPDAYREIDARAPEWNCILTFPLGDRAGRGEASNGKLDVSEFTSASLARRLKETIDAVVVSKLKPIGDIAGLLDLSLRVEGAFPGRPWADPARAAMIVFLGRKLGLDSSWLTSALGAHVGRLKSPPYTASLTPTEFLDAAVRSADAVLEAEQPRVGSLPHQVRREQ